MASVEHGVHSISDRYVDDYAVLDPVTASFQGLKGHDGDLTDLTPDGHEARAELAAAALRATIAAEPANDSESVAKALFTERIGLNLELHEAGQHAAALNVVASPPQMIRQVFDLMPTETAADWTIMAARLAKVPDALAGYQTALLYSADKGIAAARRQVERVAEQCDIWAGTTGGTPYFTTLVSTADADGALRSDLDAAAHAAGQAYADLATFLRERLAPRAPAEDAVGEEAYRLWSRLYLGAEIDLAEAYEWGWAELARVEAQMREVADRLGATTLVEAAAILDADPRYRLTSRRAFVEWMQELSDRALSELRGVHFDIPDELMRLECHIAPPGGSLGAYYTSPTDDFSRPGQMWWSVPADREEFLIWREASTVYHEGVPGHHLQIATAVHQAANLNRFQRMIAWIPGHGEGWALYAERLMHEFGYLDDDGSLFGMLDAHLFRAARVIIDIGMHLKLPIPAGADFHEGECWTPELGLEFLTTRTATEHSMARDEIDRYLGWPGQAIAYKLGERRWLAARDDLRARHGNTFDLKQFHMSALRMGPMGLDLLTERLAAR